MKTPIPITKKLILFDGVCNLCNSSIQFIIKYDKKEVFLFAPLQSEIGKTLINEFKVDTKKTDSILLYLPSHAITSKAEAILNIAKHLRFPINLAAVFLILPNTLTNKVYQFIAKNRYKWFGKKKACMVPTAKLKARFLN